MQSKVFAAGGGAHAPLRLRQHVHPLEFEMFDLALPWWELVCRAVIVYLALMVMVRVSGKRTVGQFTPFDLLVVMLLS